MIDLSNENKFKRKSQQLTRRKPCQKIKYDNLQMMQTSILWMLKMFPKQMKTLLSKSNSFRKTAKEKNEELNQCQSILKELFKKKDDCSKNRCMF